MAAGLNEFTERLGIGINVNKNLKPRLPPGLQTTFELANVGVAHRGETIRRLGHKAFTSVIEDDRYVLARKPDFRLERDPVRRHVGGEQRMTGGIGGLMAQIEQRDFLAQQQHAAEFRWADGWEGHGPTAGGTKNGALPGRPCYFNRRPASGRAAIIAFPAGTSPQAMRL